MQLLASGPVLMETMRLYYQPVVRLATARLDYVEVLARAAAEGGGILEAERVVDAMTGAEISMDITGTILRRALADHAEHDFGSVPMAVNLPLDALLHPELTARIEAKRAAAGLPWHLLRFELTERHPVHDLAAASAVIAALREAGHGLALDDITPDMPYLDALLDMPVSAVKLDRSVVVTAGAENEAFIRGVVARCAPRGVSVVAEGIETAAQAARMQELGATHGQGFLFARPLSPAGLRAYLHHT